jgi:hypothetical protein
LGDEVKESELELKKEEEINENYKNPLLLCRIIEDFLLKCENNVKDLSEKILEQFNR